MGCLASKSKVEPLPQGDADGVDTEKPPSDEAKAMEGGAGSSEGSKLIDEIVDRVAGIRAKAEEYRDDIQAQAIQIEQEKANSTSADDQACFNGVVITTYTPEDDVAGSAVVEAKQGDKVEIIVRDAGGWAYCRLEASNSMGWLPSSRMVEIARLLADHDAALHEGLLSASKDDFVEVVSRHYSGWAFCREWNGPPALDSPPRKEGWVTDSYLEDKRSQVMLASKWHRLVLQALDQVVLSALELEGVLAQAKEQDWGGDLSAEWMQQCLEFTRWLTNELQNITKAVSQHEQSVDTGMYATVQWETAPGSTSELKVEKGDMVLVLDSDNVDWAWCRLDKTGDEGWVPKNILQVEDGDRQDEGAHLSLEDLPSWIKEGNPARWWSNSGNRFCDVKISKVDEEAKEVTVVFVVDNSCWKSVSFDHFSQSPEEWLLHAQEDKAEELRSQLPSWVEAGAAGYWWSSSQRKVHRVAIREVCTRRRAVVVSFEADRKVRKSVPFHKLIDDPDDCFLQKSEKDHAWRLKKKKRKKKRQEGRSDSFLSDLEGVPIADEVESLDGFIADDDGEVDAAGQEMSCTEKNDFRREANNKSFKKSASRQLSNIFDDMQQDLGDMLGPEAAAAVESGSAEDDIWKNAQLLSPTSREVREMQSLADQVRDAQEKAQAQARAAVNAETSKKIEEDKATVELEPLRVGGQAAGGTSSGGAAQQQQAVGAQPARHADADAAASAPASDAEGGGGAAPFPDAASRLRSDSFALEQLREELEGLTAESPRKDAAHPPAAAWETEGLGGSLAEASAASFGDDISLSVVQASSIEDASPSWAAVRSDAAGAGANVVVGAAPCLPPGVGIGGAEMRAAALASDSAPSPPTFGAEEAASGGASGGDERRNKSSGGSVAGESTVGELRWLGRGDAAGDAGDLGGFPSPPGRSRSSASNGEYTQSEQGLMDQLDVLTTLASPGRESNDFFNTQERKLLEELGPTSSRSSSPRVGRRRSNPSVDSPVKAPERSGFEPSAAKGHIDDEIQTAGALVGGLLSADADEAPAPAPPPAEPPRAAARSSAAWGDAAGGDAAAAPPPPPPPRRVSGAWGEGAADAPAPTAPAPAAERFLGAGASAEADEWGGVSENVAEEMREAAAAFGTDGARVSSLFKQAMRAVFPDTWDSEGEGRRRKPPDTKRLQEHWPELEEDLRSAADAGMIKLRAKLSEELSSAQAAVEAKIEDVGHKLEVRARQAEGKLDPATAQKYRSMQWSVMNEGERAKEVLVESMEAQVALRKQKSKCQAATLKKALVDPAGALASVFLPDSMCLSGLLPPAALLELAEAAQELYRSVEVAAIRPSSSLSLAEGPSDFLRNTDRADTTQFEVAGEAAIRALGNSLEAIATRLRRERDEMPQSQVVFEELEWDGLSRDEVREKKMFVGTQEIEWARKLDKSVSEQTKRRASFFNEKLGRAERILRRRYRRTREREKAATLKGLAAFGNAIGEVEQNIRAVYREHAEKAEAEVERVEKERRSTQEQTQMMLSAAIVIREEKEVMNTAWYSPPKERQAVMFKCLKRVRRLQEDMKGLDIMPELKQKHSVLLYSLRMLEAKLKGECTATPNDILEGPLKLTSSQKKQLQDARRTFEQELASDLEGIRASHSARAERTVSRLASEFRVFAEGRHVPSLQAARASIDASVSQATQAELALVALRPFADAAAALPVEALRHVEVARSPLDAPTFIPKRKRLTEALDKTLHVVEKLQKGLNRPLQQLAGGDRAAPDREWESALAGAEKRWREFCERHPEVVDVDSAGETPRSEAEVLEEGRPANASREDSLEDISPPGYASGRRRRGGNAGAAGAKAKARARGSSPQGQRPARPTSAVPNGRPPSAGGQPPAPVGGPRRVGFQGPPGMKGSEIGGPPARGPSRAPKGQGGGGGQGAELLAQLDELSNAMDMTLGKTKSGGFGRTGGGPPGGVAGAPPPRRPAPPQRRGSGDSPGGRRPAW